ncbi:cysteine--tRNA ligase [Mesomycoplasma lagogenitalium]|uniref:Cysteine--tRNA ligase n=1 Tax=Mesomycoplasma lagogenitalium TaxID=171286 RepID=A0ABY8LWD9_9BACT|nr:cysteine--tRNA ligase [Mesomycoplasma lagogenitalium]WGI36868.1 cysteine--tRNA ligase [Mesomycoplasma lagogenitalium]
MKKENLYLCGPTVYNHVHIGNIRSLMFFDLWNRVKKHFNYEINYLHNITDIDDKIIQKAIEENKSEKEISEYYYQEYLKLFEIYNIEKPTTILKITDKLNWIIEYIDLLMKNNSAYKSDENVFFDVSSFNKYGMISNRDLENSEDKIDQNFNKKNPQDFALWKKTDVGIKYDSPFGLGRPGWHTECSAMIYYYFNKQTIDIHGGGIDLIFPHHENENAQHFSLTDKPITHFWKHSGFLNKDGQKMSKSIGNVLLAKDFAIENDPDVFRHLILSTNLSSPLNLTKILIEENSKKIEQFKRIYNKYYLEKFDLKSDENLKDKILNSILNLDFALANKEINNLLKDFNNSKTLIEIWRILGFKFAFNVIDNQEIELYDSWKKARNEKKYVLADRLREKLALKKLI